MKWTVSTARGAGMVAMVVSMAVSMSAAVAASQQSRSHAHTLEGVWHVQVTLRNCETAAPLAPPVNSLVTFAAGGTLQESVGGGGFALRLRFGPRGDDRLVDRRLGAQRVQRLLARLGGGGLAVLERGIVI